MLRPLLNCRTVPPSLLGGGTCLRSAVRLASSTKSASSRKPTKRSSSTVKAAKGKAVGASPSQCVTAVSHEALRAAETVFSEMADLRSLQGEGFRAVAYSKAVASSKWLRKSHADVDPIPLDQVKKASGFGTGMLDKLFEMMASDDGMTLREHKKLSDSNFARSARFIMSVHGFGPKRAAAIAHSYGGSVRNIDDLNALAKTEEFTHSQMLGIQYYADSQLRIPREEVARHETLLEECCRVVDVDLRMSVCGSYRRKLPTSGDVDCLMTWSSSEIAKSKPTLETPRRGAKKSVAAPPAGPMANLVAELQSRDYIRGMLGHGATKVMAFSQLESSLPVRRLDVRWVDPESFPTALLYFTGSADFNARMRGVALAKGFTLNEYGLFHLVDGQSKPMSENSKSTRGGKRVPVATERDVFDAIGFDYVEPHDRR